ncbi:MAG: HAMP domain-containing histidine kinase [Anaerolineae bacterium]|nr:HAMP domain-containing histidine kinase [Anaerolineae bacterium]
MANAPDVPIELSQALETLQKLQGAAPAATASKLRQISALLRTLADENAYLNTLIFEDMGGPAIAPQVPAAPAPPLQPPQQQPAFDFDLDYELGLLGEAEEPPEAEPEAPAMTVFPAESLIATTESRTVTGLLRSAEQDAETTALFSGLNDSLRPPLIAIRGRAELVQVGFLGQITPEQDQWLQAVQENTDRAFAVLDAIQDMIALKKGQVRIEPMNFISTDLLAEAWDRIRDRARQFNHEITLQAPDVVPLARGDFYQALTVLTDMLDNAMRYTPPGGQIRMSVDNLGTHVLFNVVDTGVGLTPEDLDHVGQPFWRGTHQRLVRAHNGTGLRLYIAKQILALQDGEMIFSGEPNLGSTFSFTLRTPD